MRRINLSSISIIALLFFACNDVDKDKDKNGLFVIRKDSNKIEKQSFYDNGNIKYRFQMQNNLMDGVSEEFYPNGRVSVRTVWKKGRQGFLYEKYSDDGTSLMVERNIVVSKINDKTFKICLSDTLKNVSMFICSYKDNFIFGNSIVIPVKNGIGTISFLKANHNAKIKGVIRVIRDKYLFEESYPFEFDSNNSLFPNKSLQL